MIKKRKKENREYTFLLLFSFFPKILHIFSLLCHLFKIHVYLRDKEREEEKYEKF